MVSYHQERQLIGSNFDQDLTVAVGISKTKKAETLRN